MYANWGRFFARIPNDLAARALSADAGISRADYFDAGADAADSRRRAHVTQTPGGPAERHAALPAQGVGADLIDPNAKSSYMDEFVAGFEFEALPEHERSACATSTGPSRACSRTSGRTRSVACDLRRRRAAAFDYTLTNPEPRARRCWTAARRAASRSRSTTTTRVEFTVDKRFSNNWSVQASYRWSRLHGTFEGFYREDNGQSDPGITSLYDFPTNDPTYTAIGVPQFGYQGDIRYLGSLGAGPLPLDRPHVRSRCSATTSFNIGLNLGLGLRSELGHAADGAGGESELHQRRRDSDDAARRRASRRRRVQDAHAVRVQHRRARRLRVEVSGTTRIVFARGRVQPVQPAANDRLRQLVELSFGVPNPDFGKPDVADRLRTAVSRLRGRSASAPDSSSKNGGRSALSALRP